MKYCAISIIEDRFVLGDTREDIVNQIFEWGISNNRVLFTKVKGFKPSYYHSYSMDYSNEEMLRDAIDFLFGELEKYGWKPFTRIY